MPETQLHDLGGPSPDIRTGTTVRVAGRAAAATRRLPVASSGGTFIVSVHLGDEQTPDSRRPE